MLIATSPWLSSDQEKSTEDTYQDEVDCKSSKCNYTTSGGKREDMMYEEYSRHIRRSQSTYEYMTNRITSKRPKELYDTQRKIDNLSPVDYSYVKPTQLCCHKKSRESQGEDNSYHIQYAEGPSEEIDCTLETAAQIDGFGNFLQTATVESNESTIRAVMGRSEVLNYSVQKTTGQSELCNPVQSPNVQPEHHTNHLKISTVKPDKFCNSKTLQSGDLHESSHTATAQSKEPFPSLHTAAVKTEEPCTSSYAINVKSDEPFTSLHTAGVYSKELSAPLDIANVQSKKHYTLSHTATVQSEEPFTSSHTATVQSDELDKSLNTAIVLSEELCNSKLSDVLSDVLSVKPSDCFKNENINPERSCNPLGTATDQSVALADIPTDYIVSPQSLDLYDSNMEQMVRLRDRYNLQQLASNDLYLTEQDLISNSKVLDQSMQVPTVQKKGHPQMEATEDQADGTLNAGQRTSTQFAGPYHVKNASTVQSEEIYLSCDSHWSDSVTANKVAVEGDSNG